MTFARNLLIDLYKAACYCGRVNDTAALQRAVAIAGSQTELARRIGLKQAHVWNWLNKARRVPGEAVLAIEAATDGKVTRTELRPDLYPPDPSSDVPAQDTGQPKGEAA